MAKYTKANYQNDKTSKRSSAISKSSRQDFLKNIVDQLILRRQNLGLTQDKVDVLMGNADRCISKWECGDRTPTSFNLVCWADALNLEFLFLSK